MGYDSKRNQRCINDLFSFAIETKIPENEFLTAITDILAIKLASMPKKERQQLLEDIGELVESYAEKSKELPADEKRILKQVGWEFGGE